MLGYNFVLGIHLIMLISCYLASCPVPPSPHIEEDLGVSLATIHDALEHQDSTVHHFRHQVEEGEYCLRPVALSRVVWGFAPQLPANRESHPRLVVWVVQHR